jgi:RimJ/RimL family protein N-acetyltransferase
LKARNNKTEFPFIVFDKKNREVCGKYSFYDMNLDFKTVQLGYTWYGSAFRGTEVKQALQIYFF